MKRYSFAVGCLIAIAGLAGLTPAVDAAVLADFSGVREDDVRFVGFDLGSSQEIEITANGFGYRSGGTRLSLTNAWILDADTREVVWEMSENRDEWKEKAITRETYRVELPAGEYEVYYSTYPHRTERRWSGEGLFSDMFGWGRDNVVEDLMDEEGVDDVDDLYRKFSVRVEGNGRAHSGEDVERRHEEMASSAIVSIRRLADHDYVEKGFSLERAMRIRIYAIGEAREDGAYDYGWIRNVETDEVVWRFDYDDSYHAGGAKKNRVIDSTFEAPSGKYVAVFATDDSHTWGSWNSAPPHDPAFWGLTIRPENDDEARYAGTFDYEGMKMKNVVVDLTKAGDDDFLHGGFTLAKPMDLRVYALGEGRGGRMYDYGWIVNAKTREPVWEMTYARTEHAGGGDKNRVFDDVVHFEKGSYMAYYATDGSHSYPHWNTAPPMERERWGLTITGAKGFDGGSVTEYDDDDQGNYLVRISQVRDDEFIAESFTVDRQTRVHIYALGEGVDDRMYDYGWIERADDGRVVWEMTFRKTRHAGGASKNRMFSDSIVLDPGTYKVVYESDGSHSFNDWNAEKPYEPQFWGIALRVADR